LKSKKWFIIYALLTAILGGLIFLNVYDAEEIKTKEKQ